MSKTRQVQVVLLLADGFQEAAVGVILTTLRQAGLSVKLVGLRSRQVKGAHGLIIVPDTSLEQLLIDPQLIGALILPAGGAHLNRLCLDPRVRPFLDKCIIDETQLVGLGPGVAKTVVELLDGQSETLNIIELEAGIRLEDFAYTLTRQLITVKR